MAINEITFVHKKNILNGVTYDELFTTIRNMLNGVEDGWGIAKTFHELYEKANETQKLQITETKRKEIYFIVDENYYDEISIQNDILVGSLEDIIIQLDKLDRKIEGNKGISFYRVVFAEDAYLEEITPTINSIETAILNTLKAYRTNNFDVLSDYEKYSLEKQINYMEEKVVEK